VAIGNRAESGPSQCVHRVPHGFAHAPHLAVAPFTDGQHYHAVSVAAPGVDQVRLRRKGAASVERDADA